MQSRPADQLHGVLLQVKIAGQNSFDITRIGTLFHRTVQLNNATKLVNTAILGVGQYELCVVLRGHVINLRLVVVSDCEPEHNFSFKAVQTVEI